ncbi:hypothetical protein VNI00_015845 [Paramarasmius palmivorus]|uniref:Uncharacterized protein n=1 Tax=Paramarasmius palmivorus TaxID=297713 RepID=A0AAW0BH62_9AGAR
MPNHNPDVDMSDADESSFDYNHLPQSPQSNKSLNDAYETVTDGDASNSSRDGSSDDGRSSPDSDRKMSSVGNDEASSDIVGRKEGSVSSGIEVGEKEGDASSDIEVDGKQGNASSDIEVDGKQEDGSSDIQIADIDERTGDFSDPEVEFVKASKKSYDSEEDGIEMLSFKLNGESTIRSPTQFKGFARRFRCARPGPSTMPAASVSSTSVPNASALASSSSPSNTQKRILGAGLALSGLASSTTATLVPGNALDIIAITNAIVMPT